MEPVSQVALEAAIKCYSDPYLNCDLFQMKAVRSLSCEAGQVLLSVCMPYACDGIHGAMKQIITTNLEQVEGVEAVEITIDTRIAAHLAQNGQKNLETVKNVVAVASGKGGVGKSTMAVNLVLALAAEGARVGILDADIYGPSIGMMLGFPDGSRPGTRDDKYFVPLERHGVQAMSMAFLATEDTPMVWRGPMASGAVKQLLTQTHWDNLDYLIVDMPPGTGDIQLTLAQTAPVSGSVIVTTPQDIALLDCKKGIEMFRKVDIPVFGVIENMSTHTCSNCGHQEPVFGEGGGERIASEYDTTLLGQMPLTQTIREQTDSGAPTVIAEPDSEIALLYRDMARKLGAQISQQEVAFSDIIASTH